MSGNRIISPDILDTEIFDAQELSSDGYSSYLTLPLVSISSGIFTVDPTGVLSGGITIDPEFPVESGDRIYVEGATPGSADGYYTIFNIFTNTTFNVEEVTVNSTGGNILFFHPSGASRIGVNTDNFIQISSSNVQDALEELDTALASAGGDVEVQDNDVQVVAAASTLNFGTRLDVTDDGGGEITVDADVSGLVPDTRQVIAGDGLTGGGDLSADRTLDVVANADGSIVVNANDVQVGILATDAQHGDRGGGSLHAEATTSVAGFLSATDKTKLDGIETGAQVNTVDSVFGRTGDVVAASSDYDANQIDFTSNGDIAATDVQAAIVEVRDDTDTKLTGKASTSHAATHIQGGSDEIDGDQLDIDFTPTNYTPNTTPPEATDLDHLSAHLSGLDAALGSVGGSIDVEDDDSPVASGISTLNFGDSLTVTDDGSGQVTVDGENAGRAVFVIWAEENAGLNNNTYEWAFGNGDDAPSGSGIPVPIDCVLFAIGLDHNANASATVAVEADGVQIGTVTTSNERNALNTLVTPVNVSQGQVIGFETISGPGDGGGNRVSAYFRTTPFGAGAPVDSVFGRTGAVSAQASDYDANQIDVTPAGNIASTDVQAALEELDTAIGNAGSDIEVQNDDVQVVSAATTINFGSDLTVTNDGGGKVTIDSSNLVSDSREIIAGDGLTGGGDLSTDRTLDVVANADGSIVVNANDIQVGVLATDAQHGDRGGGSLHADATTSVAGFLSASDKTKLDGIENNAKDDQDADEVPYDNTTSGLVATDVQAALDELVFGQSEFLFLYDATGGLAVPGGGVAIPWDTQSKITPAFSHTTSSSEVTIQRTGTYIVRADISIDTGSSSRSSSQSVIQLDTGSGFADVSGTDGWGYHRTGANGEDTASLMAVLDLEVGDKIRIVSSEVNGASLSTLAQGSRLIIFSPRGPQGPTGAGSNINVFNEGAVVPNGPHDTVNFIGPGITATDAGSAQADVTLTTDTAVTLVPEAGNQEGSADSLARSDHVHNIPSGNPSTLTPEQGNSEGTNSSFARTDHIHNIPTDAASTLTPELGNSEGTNSSFARSDHIHDIPAGTPSTLNPDQANAEGAAASFARSDHIHNIPAAAPVTLNPDQSNAEGNSTSFARANHVHNVPTDTAVNIEAGGTSSEGVSTSFARADHVHRIIDPSTNVGGTSNLTTTSTTPVVAESITPGAGTYLVWWSTWGVHNNNFSELAVGILANGVLDNNTVRRSGGTNQSDGAELSLASQTKVTVSNGQAIAGAYWKFGGGGSVEINERTLTILKVDD